MKNVRVSVPLPYTDNWKTKYLRLRTVMTSIWRTAVYQHVSVPVHQLFINACCIKKHHALDDGNAIRNKQINKQTTQAPLTLFSYHDLVGQHFNHRSATNIFMAPPTTIFIDTTRLCLFRLFLLGIFHNHGLQNSFCWK